MPKVAYSEAEKAQVREALLTKGLELLAKQGIQHTTVEQIYKAVGISRTFFYSFFPTKESLIIEALYLQQPRVLVYAQKLMDVPSLSWREAVTQFLYACCYGEKNGIREPHGIYHFLIACHERVYPPGTCRHSGILSER